MPMGGSMTARGPAIFITRCLDWRVSWRCGWMFLRRSSFPICRCSATESAATMLRQLQEPVDQRIGQWLLERVHRDGGFLAAPAVPIPDLLSTATALHALAGLHVDFEQIKEGCLDFIDTLWTPRGSF